MTVKGPQPKPKRKEPAWSPRATLQAHRSDVNVLKRLETKLTSRERRQIKDVVGRLDREFIQEKAELVRDTIVEIQRHKHTNPSTLLQRNVWSSLDAIGMHLDQSGFTALFKKAAPKLFGDVRIDDPRFVNLEYDLMLSFLGATPEQAAAYDMPRSEIDWIFGFAQAEKKGACGFKYLASRDFTFKEFFARFCGRPDRILEIHHSPQGKATAALIIGVINIIGVFFGLVLTVITLIALVIVGCAGC
jgi:quinol monooxygenase YgiN